MYDKCYFCLDQLPKLKKESTASFFVNFGRSRGTKEPTYITVQCTLNTLTKIFAFSLENLHRAEKFTLTTSAASATIIRCVKGESKSINVIFKAS